MLMALFSPPGAFSADKGAKTLSQTSMAQVIADFGVTDIEVRSVKTLDVATANAGIREAVRKGEHWPREALTVALQLVGPGLKGHAKVIEVRTPPEQRDSATITVTESGYPDDAVGGERWRLWLVKGTDAWTIQRGLWAQLCSRPGRRFYTAEPCP